MEFFASDVTKVTGVKRGRLQVWLEKGWIVPSIQKASGHGTRNIFSLGDLYNIVLFRKVVESGLSRGALGPALAGIKPYEFDAWIDTASFGSFSFDKFPMYAAFYRKEGEVFIVRPMTLVDFQRVKISELSRADDVILINFTKIMKEVNDNVSGL